jgi:hypothetical protein
VSATYGKDLILGAGDGTIMRINKKSMAVEE